MYGSVLRSAICLFVVVGGAVACSDDDGDDDNTQIPNPASEFCVEQGGEVEIVDEADGQVGYCNLPDGTRIEEWEFFTAETGNTQP